MANQNKSLNWKTMVELQVTSDDVVLEIGFGKGTAIHQIWSHCPSSKIFGIDPSDVMLREAVELNRSGIEKGSITVLAGNAENLPFTENYFTKVFSVSTFHDWRDRAIALIEIRRVLKKEGKLLLCLRKAPARKWPWSTPGLTYAEIEEDLSLLRHAGFRDVTVKTKKWSRVLLFSGTK